MLKAIRRFSDAANVSVYTLSLAAMIFLNNAVYPFCPLSLSLLFAMLCAGASPFGCFILLRRQITPNEFYQYRAGLR